MFLFTMTLSSPQMDYSGTRTHDPTVGGSDRVKNVGYHIVLQMSRDSVVGIATS
jgi:hypothetical protein